MSKPAPDLPDTLMKAAEGEPSGRVCGTFKEGTGYDAAWIVVEAASAVEYSNLIHRLRQLDAFEGTKAVAALFRGETVQAADPLEAAAAVVRNAFPGATEVQPASGPPEQTDSKPCEKCGQSAQYREGTGKNGPYKGYACTADRTHFEHVK